MAAELSDERRHYMHNFQVAWIRNKTQSMKKKKNHWRLPPTSLRDNAPIDVGYMHIHEQRQYDHGEDLVSLVRPYSSTQACRCPRELFAIH